MKLKLTCARITGYNEVNDESNDSYINPESDDNDEHAYDGFTGLDDVKKVTGV